MTKDLVRILVIVSVNAINLVKLENIEITKVALVKKFIIDKLVEECTNVIEENKIYNKNFVISSDDCASCTVYIILFVVFLLLCLIIIVFFLFIFIGTKD